MTATLQCEGEEEEDDQRLPEGVQQSKKATGWLEIMDGSTKSVNFGKRVREKIDMNSSKRLKPSIKTSEETRTEEIKKVKFQ